MGIDRGLSDAHRRPIMVSSIPVRIRLGRYDPAWLGHHSVHRFDIGPASQGHDEKGGRESTFSRSGIKYDPRYRPDDAPHTMRLRHPAIAARVVWSVSRVIF